MDNCDLYLPLKSKAAHSAVQVAIHGAVQRQLPEQLCAPPLISKGQSKPRDTKGFEWPLGIKRDSHSRLMPLNDCVNRSWYLTAIQSLWISKPMKKQDQIALYFFCKNPICEVVFLKRQTVGDRRRQIPSFGAPRISSTQSVPNRLGLKSVWICLAPSHRRQLSKTVLSGLVPCQGLCEFHETSHMFGTPPI